jgi:threonine dehydrogenase-like Zn-dependent dehydrogenase
VEAHTKKHTFETALEMLSTTDFSWLVTHEVPLSDVERAIRLSECKQEAKSIKVVLKP